MDPSHTTVVPTSSASGMTNSSSSNHTRTQAVNGQGSFVSTMVSGSATPHSSPSGRNEEAGQAGGRANDPGPNRSERGSRPRGADIEDPPVIVPQGADRYWIGPRSGRRTGGDRGAIASYAEIETAIATFRVSTAGRIRAAGGSVVRVPERTRSGVVNPNHVNICLGRGECRSATSSATRYLNRTGQPTQGLFHTVKAQETARGLSNWLNR